MLDNHDSFTYNLAAMLRTFPGAEVVVSRPEVTNITSLHEFDKIVFSPGPGLPSEFPVMKEIMDHYSETKSILGVCLGHQMIAEYFGATLANLDTVNHGWIKKLVVIEKEALLFRNIGQDTDAGVYHSWYVMRDGLPDCLSITAVCHEGLVMALQHKSLNIHSVQFHPESFITSEGRTMLHNWLNG